MLMKKRVLEANLSLKDNNLIKLTWGNVSEIDRKNGIVAIKPSGIEYNKLGLEDIVVVDLNGEIIEGNLNPSSDLETHLELYKNFPEINSIVHTHSTWATIHSQAHLEINVMGTTHADTFNGNVPLTREMTKKEIEKDYELNTAKVIVETFKNRLLSENEIPAVLVFDHGPFVWGTSVNEALENAIILEEISKMHYFTKLINSSKNKIADFLLDKHYYRKHGEESYYGQKKNEE